MNRLTVGIGVLTILCCGAYAQEFEVASIKAGSPNNMFHAPDSGAGGPGSSDPETFRCASCTLSALITKAFALQGYEFPGAKSLPTDPFAVSAKIPAGTTPAQFQIMLQNLLKDRFGLTYHFDQKELQGYHLTVAKNGPKLTEATDAPKAKKPDAGNSWHGGEAPSGTFFSMSGAQYRGDHQTTAELAQAIANQLEKPVDDQTGLTGKYDIQLKWAADNPHAHAAGPDTGFGHDHGGGAAAASDNASGPTIFEALQSQLGLRLAPASKTTARVLVVDHIEHSPTAN